MLQDLTDKPAVSEAAYPKSKLLSVPHFDDKIKVVDFSNLNFIPCLIFVSRHVSDKLKFS